MLVRIKKPDPLVPEPSSFEVEIVEKYQSPGVD
jgi:hypothetical protein